MIYRRIALILMLITMIILPVSAIYTPRSYSVTGITENPDVKEWQMDFNNVSMTKNISHLTVTGYGYYSAPFDVTYSDYVTSAWDSGITYPNYTAHVTGTGAGGSYHQPYTADFTFTTPNSYPNTFFPKHLATFTNNIHPDRGDPAAQSPLLNSYAAYPFPAISFGGSGYVGNGSYTITYDDGSPYANVTFSISDSVSFTTKLSNVTVILSNGQSAITNANGTANISVNPARSIYTYSLTKTGYTSKYMESLGGYGETGGTVYNTLVSGTTTLPPGYIRTTVHTIDALTGSQIHGTTINLKDVQNGTWVNSTADADGELIIDVLDTHTLDIYGSYPGVYTASLELGAVPGGDYYLPMYSPVPTAPAGYVNVLTYVKDGQTDIAIGNAKVDYRYPTGITVSTMTDTYGSSLAVLQNATVIIISTSKSEYNSQSESHTLPNFGDVMYVVRLSKPGMPSPTAVPTDAYGNPVTAVPTYLQYCNPAAGDYDSLLCGHSQDNALFGQLRESGSAIIGLCILAIIFGLLKMIMKF